VEAYTAHGHELRQNLEIKRSVHGLKESAAVWFKELSAMLQEQGYERSDADPRLFIHPKHMASVNIHVDNCLCSCRDGRTVEKLKKFFQEHKC